MSVFTVMFPAYGGEKTGQVDVPWVRGKTLKQYWREQPMKQHHIFSKLETHKFYNSKKQCVKQFYSPEPDEVIVVVRAPR